MVDAVTIDLGSLGVYEVRPTFKALMEISKRYGGLIGATEAIGKLDIDAIVTISYIFLKNNGADILRDVLGNKIVELGLSTITSKLAQLLANAINAGPEEPEVEPDKGDSKS